MSTRNAKILLTSGLGALLAVVVGSILALRDDEAARSVQLREGDVVVVTGSLDDALDEASRRAGFEIVAPGALPNGFAVTEVQIPAAPPPLPNGGQRPDFRVVSLNVRGADGGFQMQQLKSSFQPSIDARKLETDIAGAEVYYIETETAVVYNMMADGRGFSLNFDKAKVLPREQVLAILKATRVNAG